MHLAQAGLVNLWTVTYIKYQEIYFLKQKENTYIYTKLNKNFDCLLRYDCSFGVSKRFGHDMQIHNSVI